jgi:nitrite reductase/ring-hydroxylating ferredoxin subunit
MARKARVLKAPYSGYDDPVGLVEDAELTHVGRGQPAGEYLRRFWQPVAFSHELHDLPLRLRILGEDLVLFRDGRGILGLLKLHCSHRGTSLEYGRISERGIRCCYHAWLYDVDGTILEMPGEPPGSTFKDRLFQGAYPVHEYRGLIFAYLGPPEKRPAFPVYDVFESADYRLVPGRKHVLPCYWLQIKENCMDPVHLVYLHTKLSGPQFNESHALLPQLRWQETPIGLIVTQTRRVGPNVWSRNSELIWPNINQFGPTWEDGTQPQIYQRPMHTIWSVPIDDTQTMNISFMLVDDADGRDPERIRESFGQTGDRPYEESQRVPGDYEAFTGQGPIAVHAREHHGATDRGVLLFRNQLRQNIRAVQRGGDPKGVTLRPTGPIPTYCFDAVVPIPAADTAAGEQAILDDVERKVATRHYLEHRETVGVG